MSFRQQISEQTVGSFLQKAGNNNQKTRQELHCNFLLCLGRSEHFHFCQKFSKTMQMSESFEKSRHALLTARDGSAR